LVRCSFFSKGGNSFARFLLDERKKKNHNYYRIVTGARLRLATIDAVLCRGHEAHRHHRHRRSHGSLEPGHHSAASIWNDPWISSNSIRRIITPRRGSILQKVIELINPATGYWDEQLIKDIFWEEDARLILSLPIVEDTEDFWPGTLTPRESFQ